ncbi:hypothetical protein [Moheibacter sediminis]|uniref:Uncharacterized protein n=1 Tax=Moheibacter sediminis TaxID=1434700 RepID=A0A1W1YBP1_9FLAO|nr:hypothetical protein [Moheibacter sediminis]SMC33592.1 hypothetical protein SAMN06296427_101232 [Moheibacter sediminis]
MEIENNPLLFFEDLLESDKYKILQKDYMDRYIEKYENLKYNNGVFDYERGIIIENEDTDLSFHLYFDNLINTEYYNAKQNLDKNVLEIVKQNVSPKEFLKLQTATIDFLLTQTKKYYLTYPIIEQALLKLKNHLVIRFNLKSSHGYTEVTKFPSFEWDYLDGCQESAIETLRSLSQQLSSKSIIECSEEDFINAFMGKEVLNGVKWLIKTKDRKHSSKPTLFAFIDYLIEENFIIEIKEREYNNAIEYVFREYNGELLKNIRQSKSSSTAIIPVDIQTIIDNLHSPTFLV